MPPHEPDTFYKKHKAARCFQQCHNCILMHKPMNHWARVRAGSHFVLIQFLHNPKTSGGKPAILIKDNFRKPEFQCPPVLVDIHEYLAITIAKARKPSQLFSVTGLNYNQDLCQYYLP